MSRFARQATKREKLRIEHASNVSFAELLASENAKRHVPLLPTGSTLLALDPGETTGLAVYTADGVVKSGQIRTSPKTLDMVFDQVKPTHVVCEEFLLYSWKAMEQAMTKIRTLRYIGMIEYITSKNGIPLYMQTAQVGKSFCTNEKLIGWGFYKPGQPHAMDAVRHLCQFLLFYGRRTIDASERLDLSKVQ